jgi:hypothetical protein
MWAAWIVLVIVAVSVRQMARFATKTHTAKMDSVRKRCTEASAHIIDLLLLDIALPHGLETPAAVAVVFVASGQTTEEALTAATMHVPGTSYNELSAALADSLDRSSHHLKLVFAAFRSV